MSSVRELVLRMVADGELSSAQALSLFRRLAGAGVSTPRVQQPEDAILEALDIAVIGMSLRVASADDADAFWRMLTRGESAVTEAPAERWSVARFYSADSSRPNTTNCKWGGFLRDVERFDPLF